LVDGKNFASVYQYSECGYTDGCVVIAVIIIKDVRILRFLKTRANAHSTKLRNK